MVPWETSLIKAPYLPSIGVLSVISIGAGFFNFKPGQVVIKDKKWISGVTLPPRFFIKFLRLFLKSTAGHSGLLWLPIKSLALFWLFPLIEWSWVDWPQKGPAVKSFSGIVRVFFVILASFLIGYMIKAFEAFQRFPTYLPCD